MKKLLEKNILYTINSQNKLNEYVPNSHIGIVFSEVYEWIGYFESGQHIELFGGCDFEGFVREVFEDVELSDEIVHTSYQKLGDKYNRLRNAIKLFSNRNDGSIMKKKICRGSSNIYEEFVDRAKTKRVIKKRFHICQYKTFYSFSKKEFIRFLEDGTKMREKGYDLENYNTKILKVGLGVFDEFWKPLDWDVENFKWELQAFKEKYC